MAIDISELMAADDLRDGVWIEYREGVRFKIAYVGRKEYLKATARHTAKFKPHKLEADRSLYVEIAVQVAADTILIDFEGISQDGKPLANTRENRLMLLRAHEIANWINEQSKELSNFQREAIAGDAEALKSQDGLAASVGQG